MDKKLLDSFDTSNMSRRTVVRCATQEEADILLEYLCLKGVWNFTEMEILKRHWGDYGCSTCYNLFKASWCYDSWYEENMHGICIVDFCDIYKGYQNESCRISYSYEELFE